LEPNNSSAMARINTISQPPKNPANIIFIDFPKL
jgi:hypothetical protein